MQLNAKEEDINNNVVALRTVKEELKESVQRGKELYEHFCNKREQVSASAGRLSRPIATVDTVKTLLVDSCENR